MLVQHLPKVHTVELDSDDGNRMGKNSGKNDLEESLFGSLQLNLSNSMVFVCLLHFCAYWMKSGGKMLFKFRIIVMIILVQLLYLHFHDALTNMYAHSFLFFLLNYLEFSWRPSIFLLYQI